MSGRRLMRRTVTAFRDGGWQPRPDALAAEEPMEVRVGGEAVAVTMRTPGNDFELALGFCLSEGIVAAPGDVGTIRYCAGVDPDTGLQTYNVVDLQLRDPTPVPVELRRNVYTTSSCGICGTASLEAVRKRLDGVGDDDTTVAADVITALPDRLRAAQQLFDRTGGVHAAGVFTADGELICAREDVGRHNAVDKVLGWAATAGALPLAGHVLMVSGRVAFEIAQKALTARIPVVVAVSAPSSLAVELAAEADMTLVGFVRGGSFNVYSGRERIT